MTVCTALAFAPPGLNIFSAVHMAGSLPPFICGDSAQGVPAWRARLADPPRLPHLQLQWRGSSGVDGPLLQYAARSTPCEHSRAAGRR